MGAESALAVIMATETRRFKLRPRAPTQEEEPEPNQRHDDFPPRDASNRAARRSERQGTGRNHAKDDPMSHIRDQEDS
jgi:hypothetical protein